MIGSLPKFGLLFQGSNFCRVNRQVGREFCSDGTAASQFGADDSVLFSGRIHPLSLRGGGVPCTALPEQLRYRSAGRQRKISRIAQSTHRPAPISHILFREAVSEKEFEQIHALNHRVFAEEIAQHEQDPSGLLIDRFHAQNRYFVAVRDGAVIGMISAHAGPDFSIQKRLPDSSVLNALPKPMEVRLLAIEPRERNHTVLTGLLWQVYEHAVANGFSHLLISAITTREAMYRKLGFRALGPEVPDGSASFIPMTAALDGHHTIDAKRVRLHERHWRRMIDDGTAARNGMPIPCPAMEDEPIDLHPLSLLPGPVAIHPSVARAFASPPVSHRSKAFVEVFERVRSVLNAFLPGMEAAVFPGAGTLANDAVGANLRALFRDEEGLVLSNGEFGDRLARQASRAGLRFRTLSFPYGAAWAFDAIRAALEREPRWIWAVHLETSTGVLNDAPRLLGLAREAGCAAALDCVSSLGAVAMESHPEALWMVSGVSGKSLGAYAGLAFVYANAACRHALARTELCPSFDLTHMLNAEGPVSTVASPALLALACALEQNYETEEARMRRCGEYRRLGESVRCAMRAAGLEPLAAEAIAAPNITTFPLPYPQFVEDCRRAGYVIAHESPYLVTRGWGQIATMGDVTEEKLEPLFRTIAACMPCKAIPAQQR